MSATWERELVNILTELGYGAVRIPSSGAGTDRDLPDILWGEPLTGGGEQHAHVYAIEHKSGSDTTLYVEDHEVASLGRFAKAFGAEPMLAARFTSRDTPTGHYLVRPSDARMTDAGHYGLPIDDIETRAMVVWHPNDD